MTIRSRMMLSMILTVGMILSVMMFLSYKQTEKTIEDQALYSFEENVQKTCALLDSKLEIIKEAMEKLNLETRLYQLFFELDSEDSLELLRASQEIKKILSDYFPWYSNIYSLHLCTSYYRFGSDEENYYPNFMKSEIASAAYEAEGKSVWFPTYSYTEMYHITNLTDDQIPYGKLFTVASLMNLSDVTSGKVKRLDEYGENPVLVINFKPDYMEKVLVRYEKNNSLKDTEYYVMDEEGTVVYSTDEGYPAGEVYKEYWLEALESGSAYDGFFVGEEKKYLLSYCRSEITGWLVVMKIPVASLIGELRKQYIEFILMFFVILLAASAIVSWLNSTLVNRQFYQVIGTINLIGQGNFPQKLQYDPADEFSFFYKKLEQMSNNLSRLIRENYEVKLLQKDAEIRALNTQLNPHFIYNTLNIINWTCLAGNTDTASQMLVNLSRMLYYTSHYNGMYEVLRNDIEWLNRYFYIMKMRLDDGFSVLMDIPDEFMDLRVPKLFLQPFVENALVHGFKGMEEKGILEIHAEWEGENAVFYVEDNGCGMTQEKIEAVMNGNPDSIGIANVNQRLKILYGSEYGVEYHSQMGEGTCVIIRIPGGKSKKMLFSNNNRMESDR